MERTGTRHIDEIIMAFNNDRWSIGAGDVGSLIERIYELEREKDELIGQCHPEFGTLWREIGELREELEKTKKELAEVNYLHYC